jgi:tetratricopeptide (TPR) repeat protein
MRFDYHADLVANTRSSSMEPATPLIAAAVFVVVFAVFAPAIDNGFVHYDDDVYVVENAATRAGVDVVVAVTLSQGSNWHPLTFLSHMLDVQLWGLDPRMPHAENVALHALNAALAFAAAYAVTRRRFVSLASSLLFALHPLRVESVAWVSERKDVLSAFFLLACVLAWTRWVRARSGAAYACALAFAVAGLLSKPSLVPLPLALFVVDAALGRFGTKHLSRALVEKLPFVVAAVVVAVMTVRAQSESGAVVGADALPLALRAQTALVAFAFYDLGHTLWPAGLHAPYDYPASWPLGIVAASVAVVVAVVVVAVRRNARGDPSLLLALAWVVLFLAPVAGLVAVGVTPAADRYMYLPSLGLSLGVVVALARMPWSRAPVVAGAAALVLCVVVCVALTERQIPVWRDAGALFTNALAAEPNNAQAHFLYAQELAREGKLDDALAHVDKAIALRPGLKRAPALRGDLLVQRGDPKRAIEAYVDALSLDEDQPCVHRALAAALDEAGDATSASAERAKGASCQAPAAFVTAHAPL